MTAGNPGNPENSGQEDVKKLTFDFGQLPPTKKVWLA
jgi:hypothetical protein